MAKRVIRAVWQVLSLLLTCSVIGGGVGFILGELTVRRWARPEQIAFAEGATGMGIMAAAVLGPMFYLLLDRSASFRELSAIVASSLIAGAIVALARWQMMVPIVTVIAGTIAALAIKIVRTGDLIGAKPEPSRR